VDTSVTVTMELLLLPIQWSILAFPWKYLFWIPDTLQYVCTEYTQKSGAISKVNKKFISQLTRAQHTVSDAATVYV
jgi:hypothetical protein